MAEHAQPTSLPQVRVAPQARRAALDGAGPLALLLAIPFLLSLAGVPALGLVPAVAVLFLALAAVVGVSAAHREGEPRGAWLGCAVACATGAAAVALAAAGAGDSLPRVAGLGAALALLAGLSLHLRLRLRHARAGRLPRAAPGLLLGAGAVALAVPGADGLPAAATVVHAAALAVAALLAVVGRRRQDLLVGLRLACAALLALAAAAGDAAQVADPAAGAAMLAGAAWFLASAAVAERPPASSGAGEDATVAPAAPAS